MLSLSKMILLVCIVAAVWFGWRWLRRVEAVGRDRLNRQGQAPGRGSAGTSPGGPESAGRGRVTAEDMEKCPECGVYVAPASATSCGRAGCPYGRG